MHSLSRLARALLGAVTALAAALLPACAPEPAPQPQVDTSGEFGGCNTCHPKQAKDMRSTKHFQEAIRCATCHGQSEDHIAQPAEAPPDATFTGIQTDYLCTRCHQDECRHAQTYQAPPNSERMNCADCHGAHGVTPRPQLQSAE
jgi:hypothetical protein